MDAPSAVRGPAEWFNVFTPVDVLSSHFRDDSLVGEATVGVPPEAEHGRKPVNITYWRGKSLEEMSTREFWTFTGLSSHAIYWGSRAESEETVFSEVVTRIYAGEPVLA